jgi:hypothetical protein
MTKFKITIGSDDPPEGYDEYTVEFKTFEDSTYDIDCERDDCPWYQGFPECGSCRICGRQFKEGKGVITAREWAEDYAYNKADKRQFKVGELT